MTQQKWTLLDVDRSIYMDEFRHSSTARSCESGETLDYSISKTRLRGGLQDGVDIVEIDNGRCRFTVLVTRGMSLLEARQDGVRFGWNSPTKGPVHPNFVPLTESGGIGWLDGFNEMLVRCGLESNGAPELNDDGTVRYPLHGKIGNIPARKLELIIDEEEGLIELTGVVHETRLFFAKLELQVVYRTRIGVNGLDVEDTIANLSDEPGEFQLLYHINFGRPVIDPGAKVIAPFTRLAPRDAGAAQCVDAWDTIDPETPGSSEVCYFTDPAANPEDGQVQTLLRNSAADKGVMLCFDSGRLPCFTLWKSRLTEADGYVVGLEPGTNYPNTRSYEKSNGRVVALEPKADYRSTLSLRLLTDSASVEVTENAVRTAQQAARSELVKAPIPGWSESAG